MNDDLIDRMLDGTWRESDGPIVKEWASVELDNEEVHVVPMHDDVMHLPEDCICGATIEAVFREDGSNGWLVTHHSIDGREKHE